MSALEHAAQANDTRGKPLTHLSGSALCCRAVHRRKGAGGIERRGHCGARRVHARRVLLELQECERVFRRTASRQASRHSRQSGDLAAGCRGIVRNGSTAVRFAVCTLPFEQRRRRRLGRGPPAGRARCALARACGGHVCRTTRHDCAPLGAERADQALRECCETESRRSISEKTLLSMLVYEQCRAIELPGFLGSEPYAAGVAQQISAPVNTAGASCDRLQHRTAAITNRKSLSRWVGHLTDVRRSNVLRFFSDGEDGVDTMTCSVPEGKSGVAATATQEWAPRAPRPDETRAYKSKVERSTPAPDGIARRMKLGSWRLCLLISSLATVMLSTSPSAAVPPGTSPTLSALLDLTAARLRIARQVALSKWDSGKPVEDLSRESAVIAAAVKEARANGVSAKLAVHFFTDQIEANKLVQYALLAEWRRSDHAPDDARADLENEIRPELDRLKGGFIHVLAQSGEFRNRTDCSERISRATREYIATHSLNSLYALAMDRALARICERD